MTVSLSLFAGAGAQFFDNSGKVLTGGLIYTYAAGTTTPQTTYTSSSGATPQANPIVLDSSGRVSSGEIWLTSTLSYKFVLKTSAGVTLQTLDNVSGGVDGASLASSAGSSYVGFLQAGTGAVTRTVQSKLRDVVSVTDFGAVGDDSTDDTQAFVNALATGKNVYVPYGTYKITSSLNLKEGGLIGDGVGVSGGQQTVLKFYNLTSTTIGAIYTRISTQKGLMPVLKNLYILASSWNATTGCLGYGLDIEAPLSAENVIVEAFKKSNVFFHNDATGNGPYESVFKNVYSRFSGNHGFLIGAGANVVTLQSCQGKWNGSASYGVAPSVAGSYSGLYIDNTSDGSGPYYSFTPTSVTIISGDFSYNSKYGIDVQSASSLNMKGCYAEQNLSSDTYQHNVKSISSSYADFGLAILGAGKILNVAQTNTALAQGNTIIANGYQYGGALNGGYLIDKSISTTSYAGAITPRVVYLGADDVGATNNTVIYALANGDALHSTTGTGKHIFDQGLYVNGAGTVKILSGSGSPETQITAAVGSLYLRTNGGANTTLYVKESGTGNTGWVAK